MKSSDSPQKPDDPVRVAYSRDELTGLMVEWMCKKSGEPEFLHEEAKERWFANAGRLFMFIRDHFPVENV